MQHSRRTDQKVSLPMKPAPTAEQIKLDWANNPRWNGVKRNYTAEDVVRLRGTVHVEHSLARLGAEKLWSSLHSEAVRQRARRADRQPGDAAGQGRPQGDLSVRLAGRGRRERRRRDVSGPVAVSGQFGAAGRQAHQQRAAARRPAQPRRRQRQRRLPAADRRRCRSRFRRRAQCVRADEGDDRSRRRRRAFRGPARLRQEVRPHGRQGARADARSGREAQRRAPCGRRDAACRRCSSRAPMPKRPTC